MFSVNRVSLSLFPKTHTHNLTKTLGDEKWLRVILFDIRQKTYILKKKKKTERQDLFKVFSDTTKTDREERTVPPTHPSHRGLQTLPSYSLRKGSLHHRPWFLVRFPFPVSVPVDRFVSLDSTILRSLPVTPSPSSRPIPPYLSTLDFDPHQIHIHLLTPWYPPSPNWTRNWNERLPRGKRSGLRRSNISNPEKGNLRCLFVDFVRILCSLK